MSKATTQTKVIVNLPKASYPTLNAGSYTATLTGPTVKLTPGDITANVREGIDTTKIKDGTYPVTVQQDPNNAEVFICELDTPVETIGADNAAT